MNAAPPPIPQIPSLWLPICGAIVWAVIWFWLYKTSRPALRWPRFIFVVLWIAIGGFCRLGGVNFGVPSGPQLITFPLLLLQIPTTAIGDLVVAGYSYEEASKAVPGSAYLLGLAMVLECLAVHFYLWGRIKKPAVEKPAEEIPDSSATANPV